MPRTHALVGATLFILLLSSGSARADAPWRAAPAVGVPSWLGLELSNQTRFEYLDEQFRPGRPGSDGLFLTRTNLLVELRTSPLRVGVEVMDARAYLSDDNTRLDTGMINPLDILQAYVSLDLEGVFVEGDRASLLLGRQTIDLGSRRFLARNRYRNTINALTGLFLEYERPEAYALTAVVGAPVIRRPNDRAGLANNDIVLDVEHTQRIFFGLVADVPQFDDDVHFSAMLFGIFERDGDDRPTRNRRFVAPALRVVRKNRIGEPDFELETMFQYGRARGSAAPDDLEDLVHLTYFLHASVGYTFDVPTTPRASFVYDYASGDAAPDDQQQGRFDTLLGVPRGDFGPTSLYLAFHRRNIISPGVRVDALPLKNVDAYVVYRPFWLASPRDAWTTAGLVDPTGRTGSFIGHQIEARVRWHVRPKNLLLEFGLAHLIRRGFGVAIVEDGAAKDPTLVYAMLGAAI